MDSQPVLDSLEKVVSDESIVLGVVEGVLLAVVGVNASDLGSGEEPQRRHFFNKEFNQNLN